MATAAARARDVFDPAAAEAALLERCDQAVERARALGADEAEACASSWRSISVRFEKGDLKLAQVDRGSTLGVRVLVGKRIGFSSTNQGAGRALEACAADAVALARLAPPDPHNALPGAREVGPGLDLVRSGVADLSVERAVDLGRTLVERALAHDARLSIDGANIDASALSRAIVTTHGIRASESDAAIGCGVMGMAIDGDDVGGMHYASDSVRDPGSLDAAVHAAVTEFAEVSVGNLGARGAESYAGPVLFSPDAFLDVLVSPLVSAASAIAVQRGRSPLAGRLGQAIASPSVTVEDDASDTKLAGASAFDREGQPCGRYAVVEGGVLAGFLYNAYAAAVEGRASTGHARGSPRSVPGLGTHAVSVRPGSSGDRAALLRELRRGLYVQRFSGTVDPASGDFSGVAKSSRWVEEGAFAFPVRETLIAGNVFDLLRRVLGLSSAAERCSGEALAPFALVDAVRVTAG